MLVGSFPFQRSSLVARGRICVRILGLHALLLTQACVPVMPEVDPGDIRSDSFAAPSAAVADVAIPASGGAVTLRNVPERVVSVRTPARSLTGRVVAAPSFGNENGIAEGERFDLIEARLGQASYRVLQSPLEIPLKAALVLPLGPGILWTGTQAAAYTDADGRFRLQGIDAFEAPFLEIRALIGGKTLRLFGFTRTGGSRDDEIVIDVASTLVVREILRFWQRSDYTVSFRQIKPADVEPLLFRLRRLFQEGLPARVSEDIMEVNRPRGPWSADSDRRDGALRMLDEIANREPDISKEIDRLYTACNYLLTGLRDPKRTTVPRPPRISPRVDE